jgi:outer membrane protein TolC
LTLVKGDLRQRSIIHIRDEPFRNMPAMRPLFLCLLIPSLYAHGESLAEAWRAADAANPALQAEQASAGAAQAREQAATALDWPSISLSAGYLRLSDAPSTSVDLTPFGRALAGTPLAAIASRLPAQLGLPLSEREVAAGQFGISYPLYAGGRIVATQAAAREARSLAGANVERVRQDLHLQVAEYYLNVQRADAAADVASSYHAGLVAHLADVRDMEKQGMAAAVERMTAEVALADAARRRIDARQAQDLARAAYNRLLGRELDAAVQLAPLPAAEWAPLQPKLDEALARRPELAALSAGEAALRHQAEAARGAELPNIALTAMHLRWNGVPTTPEHTNAIGLVMNWSLFDGGMARQQAAALRQDAEAVADKRRDARSLIELDLRRATLAEQSAVERQHVSQAGDTLAQEALRLTRARYHEGVATQTEVLAAESRQADTRRALLDADFDLQLARLKMRRAMGQL